MLLQYEVGVIGLQTLARAQRSIEAGFVQHQRRLNRIVGGSATRTSGAGGAASAAKRESQAIEREQTRQLNYWRNAHVQSSRARMREEDKRHRVAMRNAEKEARISERAARQATASRRRFIDGAFGKVGDSVRGSVGAVGRFGAAAVGLAGGFAATNAISERIRDTKIASQLANQAGNPSLKAGLLKESRGVRGFQSEQILGGIGEFVTKTGDLDTGRQIAGSQARLSLATGANFEDLMATAGQAFNVLKDQIADPVERINELNGLMGVLAQQGALGAVEIKDLAQDFGKLGAATRGFEGQAPDLLRTMGAFAQVAVARGGAESSADASTAASRLVGDMVTHKGRFDALLGPGSLKSKSDPTKLRNPMEIMADVLEKTGGDVMKTSGLFGLESGKIFKGFAATYSEAEKKKKGSGREAVMAEFARFAGAKLSAKDITDRANSRLNDPDLRMQETIKEFNAVVADQLMPTLMRLIPEFSKLLPYTEQLAKRFAQLAQAFAEDPIGGVAKLIAAKLALDIAMSTVADSGKKLANSLSSAAAGVESATGGTAGGGKMAAGMLGAQLGITVASAIITANVVNFEKGEADMNAGGKRVQRAEELASIRAKQGLTPEQQAELRNLQIEQGKVTTAAKAPGLGETITSGALSALQYAGPVGWIAKAAGVDFTKAAPGIAGTLFDQNKETNVRTQEAFEKRIDAAAIGRDIGKAAADEIRNASATALNRGNSPSPVKI